MFRLLQKHGTAMPSSTCNPSLFVTGHAAMSDVRHSHIPWWTQPAAGCHKLAASCRPVTCCSPPLPTQHRQGTTSCSSTHTSRAVHTMLNGLQCTRCKRHRDTEHHRDTCRHCYGKCQPSAALSTHQDHLPHCRAVTLPLHWPANTKHSTRPG